jgi:uncharacterized RDD family membrane protein YckC
MSGIVAPDPPIPVKNPVSQPASAGLLRRLAALAYELILLIGVLFAATFLFLALAQIPGELLADIWRRHLLQAWILGVCGCYFCWFWVHGGQTLPMKTWRLRLLSADNRPLSWRLAVTRYLFACALAPLCGLSIFWALVDRDRQFLHDRLAGTRIVDIRN